MWFDLSVPTAIAGCFGIATSFVGTLYLIPKRIQELPAHNSERIWARFGAIGLVCVGSPAFLYLLGDPSVGSISLLEWIGIRSEGLLPAVVAPLGLFVTLFLGPLTHYSFLYASESNYSRGNSGSSKGVIEMLDDFFPNFPSEPLVQLRNLLIAPISEEFCYRTCMAPLLICAGFGNRFIITVSPLFFGISHIHHAIDHLRNGWSMKETIQIVSLQFTYTSFFGALEMFCYLRTGHLVSVSLVHMWCNLLGLPPLGFLSKHNPNYKHRKVIGAMYALGILGFTFGLKPLTDPDMYGCKLWDRQFSMV